ncbi:MAG: hypothetical protein GC201_11285 [Alphaproteobacteria bacterium]|nr:hypothetical protein [Alphaproteobacteria bacterium]
MIKISPAKSVVLAAMAASLLLGGCQTLNKLNPFRGGEHASKELKQKEEAKKHDDRPIYKPTGAIPPDSANARRSDEDLHAAP